MPDDGSQRSLFSSHMLSDEDLVRSERSFCG